MSDTQDIQPSPVDATATDADAPATPFSFTEDAAAKIQSLIAMSDEPMVGLRVGVRGGGCSGYSYFMELAKDGSVRAGKDLVVEAHGAKVIVDNRSLKFLAGTELDWETSLMGSSFQFHNPNAKRSCGCGSSFSV